jgi:hypothetical protein
VAEPYAAYSGNKHDEASDKMLYGHCKRQNKDFPVWLVKFGEQRKNIQCREAPEYENNSEKE